MEKQELKRLEAKKIIAKENKPLNVEIKEEDENHL